MPTGRKSKAGSHALPSALPAFQSFPLDRFSHATLRSKDDKNTPYQHESAKNDLFLVFETTFPKNGNQGSTSTGLVLKVLRGIDRLELLDLQESVQKALQDRNGAPFSESEPQTLPIVALVSPPRLAIRYNTAHGMVRRIQFSFTSDKDFKDAVRFLDSVGWPITEASRTKSRQAVLHSRTGYSSSSAGPDNLDKAVPSRPLSAQAPIANMAGSESVSGPHHQSLGQPTQYSSHPVKDSYPSSQSWIPPRDIPSEPKFLQISHPQQVTAHSGQHPEIYGTSRDTASSLNLAAAGLNSYEQPQVASHNRFLSELAPLPMPTFVQQQPSPWQTSSQTLISNFLEHIPDDPLGANSGTNVGQLSAPMENFPIQSQPQNVNTRSTAVQEASSSQKPPNNALVQDFVNPDKDLAAYAALPPEQRAESLDKWICAMLADENFLKLLEDMQQAWRRTGFSYLS